MSESIKRTPVAMITDDAGLTVLCDDGTVWFAIYDDYGDGGGMENHRWVQFDAGPIPGTAADHRAPDVSQESALKIDATPREYERLVERLVDSATTKEEK